MKTKTSVTISMTQEMYQELENTFGKGRVSKNVVNIIRDGLDNRQSLPEPQSLVDLIRKEDKTFFEWFDRVTRLVELRERG